MAKAVSRKKKPKNPSRTAKPIQKKAKTAKAKKPAIMKTARKPITKAVKKPARKLLKKAPKPMKKSPRPAVQPALIKKSQEPTLIQPPPKQLLLPPPSVTKTETRPELPIEQIKPIVEQAKEQEITPIPVIPMPAPPPAKEKPPEKSEAPAIPQGAIPPVLDMLPQWEDRLRLKRVIFEDGLQFFKPEEGTTDYADAMKLLGPMASTLPNHFIVCGKDRSGAIIGAMDGYLLEETLMISRSTILDDKKREGHILLYSAALGLSSPSVVISSILIEEINEEAAGKLILYGRGFGMFALPFVESKTVLTIRRMGKELDPLSDGPEIAKALKTFQSIGVRGLEGKISEYEGKSMVALIPLPTSPDTREHLHELRDTIALLALPSDNLESVLEELKNSYILGRKDITPEKL